MEMGGVVLGGDGCERNVTWRTLCAGNCSSSQGFRLRSILRHLYGFYVSYYSFKIALHMDF